MSWNLASSMALVTASLFGTKVVAPDPSFDFQLATPQISQTAVAPTNPVAIAPALPEIQRSERKMSANFHDADIRTVLRCLEENGVSFVVANKELKDQTITMSIVNQPVDAAVDAIAYALGGHWVRRGQILVFKTGLTPSISEGFFTPYGLSGDDYRFQLTDPSALGVVPKSDFTVNPDELVKRSEQIRDLSRQLQLNDSKGFTFTLGPVLRAHSFGKLMDSLTPRQRELEKTQGFLKITDLTPEQQAMAGISRDEVAGKGAPIEIEIRIGDQTLKIKS